MDIDKNKPDLRRDRPNTDMTAIVDQAIHIQTLAGSSAAAKFMSARSVPLSVIGRVLNRTGQRRKTMRAF